MSSNVTRGKRSIRPAWDYVDIDNAGQHSTLEMIESLRNVAEGIHAELIKLNALLHCPKFVGIPARLKRISRNTYVAKHKKEPGKYDV